MAERVLRTRKPLPSSPIRGLQQGRQVPQPTAAADTSARSSRSKTQQGPPVNDLDQPSTMRSSVGPEGHIFVAPDNKHVFFNWHPDCLMKASHAFGLFCSTCRDQPMNWIPGDMPPPTNAQGELIMIGPEEGMVKGVHLQEEEAVAVESIVASLNFLSWRYTEIDGFTEIMGRYPESVEAGERIADL
ncbi:uncharacterized protein LY89DRAFT_735933 [Mollisia scopiformis]|uniref:Uncharacterized protein n=1 Tax=Mollisia scopiformis TaxID=149040 RepID=A0A194X3Y0_MOLSC|nr:uncharacterized protein LY89DRAFT_735933 [Mollisia scopiformis]KUJ14871.1 hypothetical protein LY89DRAFT_735933 [Mollisia scopiformis]